MNAPSLSRHCISVEVIGHPSVVLLKILFMICLSERGFQFLFASLPVSTELSESTRNFVCMRLIKLCFQHCGVVLRSGAVQNILR